MLCRRCEHRATFYDTGHAPRYECKDVGNSVSGCYCYLPTMPAVLQRPDSDDPRPEYGGYFGCRMRWVRNPKLTEIGQDVVDMGDGSAVLWVKREHSTKAP